MVLQTSQAMGPLDGYGVARRIEQVSRDRILLNASLVRLQRVD
jgi:PadR family transcriptional regulator, regulatory protein PadR